MCRVPPREQPGLKTFICQLGKLSLAGLFVASGLLYAAPAPEPPSQQISPLFL